MKRDQLRGVGAGLRAGRLGNGYFFRGLADPYKGAAEVLQQIASASGQPAQALPKAEQWLVDCRAFTEKEGGLVSAESSCRMAGASGAFRGFDPRGGSHAFTGAPGEIRSLPYYGVAHKALFDALPGPGSWPALVKMVDARPPQADGRPAVFEGALRLLVHTLAGDAAGQREAIGALSDIKGPYAEAVESDTSSLKLRLAQQSGDPGALKASFEARLARGERAFPKSVGGLGIAQRAAESVRSAGPGHHLGQRERGGAFAQGGNLASG